MQTSYSTSSTEKLISACTGALLTSVLVTPMDVVKLRLQTQQLRAPCGCALTKSSSYSCTYAHTIKHSSRIPPTKRLQFASMHECVLPHGRPQPSVLRGTLDGVYKIAKYEGLTKLWKGLTPALAMSIPANVVYFVGYDYLRNSIKPYTTAAATYDYAPLIAGAFARTVAVTIISPIELFRTRLQATSGVGDFKRVLYGVREMVKADGPRALFRGLLPTLWRDVPFSAVYWMGFEESKRALQSMAASNTSPTSLMSEDIFLTFLAGAFSGMVAATVTTPFDVAKTRRQVGHGRETRVPVIMRQIYQQDGFRGLFRGLSARVAKVAPSCAIMISSYELGKTFFAKRHHNA